MSSPEILYTAAQTRELDRLTTEHYGISGYELMTRAGESTFASIRQNYPDAKRMIVLCGLGNNGGDGYIIARLAQSLGIDTTVYQLGDETKIQGDALTAKTAYRAQQGKTLPFTGHIPDSDIIVDAIFGTGLTRNVEGKWQQAIQAINEHLAPVISVDIPSGLNSDTGMAMGCAVKASQTHSYIGRKAGLFTGAARDYTGQCFFHSLEVPTAVYSQVLSNTSLLNKEIFQQLQSRQRTAHKGHHGHVLAIGGNEGMSGAIRLCGYASARSGAGLISIATHPTHAMWINQNMPELMVHGIQNAVQLRALISKASVIAIGPGLGQNAWARELFSLAINANCPKIVDADALNLLANTPCKRTDWVLTPHPAEAARLLGTDTVTVENDRYQAIHHLQKKYGGICILKGAGTLITDGSAIKVCPAGNPGMASGGMGDVLTGIIASLLAQKLTPFTAANMAVLAHALAADDIAKQSGERGMLASDLIQPVRQWLNP